MTSTPTKRHESDGPLPGDIGVSGGVIMHHDKRRHKQCRAKKLFLSERHTSKKKSFHQFSKSQDSRCKMSWNGRRHGVRLAKKWSPVWSDGPKVPEMRRNEKTIFY